FLQQVLIVISRISNQFATIEIDNAGRHIANKRTIVRDKNNRSVKGFQKPFQPVDSFDIQMVSRFIQ
ncbi:hypothetical protein, partial [Listeria monocytogenes]|uniref:hypothetical protein n=1 Tax=Listeria monocytogenes TaxID=1639 RepID=UPI001C0A805F